MKILKKIWCVLCAVGRAKYAAELSRNGKYQAAQTLYK